MPDIENALNDLSLEIAVGGLVCVSHEIRIDMPKASLVITTFACEGGTPVVPRIVFTQYK